MYFITQEIHEHAPIKNLNIEMSKPWTLFHIPSPLPSHSPSPRQEEVGATLHRIKYKIVLKTIISDRWEMTKDKKQLTTFVVSF